jgi:predicted short-subunit dehydrogenase-like oxidoreductase (DUF2520 family)
VDVAVVGAGRVGTTLAVLLQRAGHRIVGVSGRDATPERAARYLPGVPFASAQEVASEGELVLISVPDVAIERVSRDLSTAGAFREGQTVAHTSGARPRDELHVDPQIPTLVLHPLQTFPDVEFALRHVPGSALAVTSRDDEGYDVGRRIATDLGMRPFRLSDRERAVYHAAAVFASNYVVTVLAAAERLFRLAGVDDPVRQFLPLTRAAVDAVEEFGPGAALTGPVVRGDAATIDSHLGNLVRSGLADLYRSLAVGTLELADHTGRLALETRAVVREKLEWWRAVLDEESDRWR